MLPCRHALVLVALLAATAPARADRSAPDPMGAALERALSGLGTTDPAAGPLLDRALPLAPIERFDGSANAARADLSTWRRLYDELHRAAAPGPGLEDLDAATRGGPAGEIPLAVLNFRYQRLRADALDRGAVVVRDGRLARGAGDPFTSGRAFAIAPLRARTFRGSEVVFTLDPARWLSNDPAPRRIELDCDDGAGFRAVTLGTRITAHYHETGERTIRLRSWNDAGELSQASAGFTVAALVTPTPNDTLHVTATVPYLNQVGTGLAYVYLAPGHAAVTNPIVVIEGFDLDNSMHWDELYAQLNQQSLLETVRADGFDAVVLDFTDATDYVQKNAFVVMALIEQVEAMTASDAPLTVVGASMGGLCSRYALDWLETHGSGHRVRTWLSFDAPHRGADIPLGIQYWVQFFSGLSSDAASLIATLNRPGPRQMLVYHLTNPPSGSPAPDPLRATLLSELAAMGDWPALPRRIAVTNGSGIGANQGFIPAEQIIHYDYSSFLVNIRGNCWALPNLGSAIVFDGRIRILLDDTKQTLTVTGTQPYDGATGGWRATMAEMDAVGAPYGDIVALHPNHCFVPLISALAHDSNNLFYAASFDPTLLDHTPFEAVYVPPTNEGHVTVSAASAAWIRDQIEAGLVSAPPPARGPALSAASPNPFRTGTRFDFTLTRAQSIDLRIFGVDGREVRALVHGATPAGANSAAWDGLDARGVPAPPGLYFARLAADGVVRTTRAVRIR